MINKILLLLFLFLLNSCSISKENKNLEIESKNEELIIELEDNLETTDLDNTIKYIEFEKNIIDSSQKDQLDIIYLDLYNLGLQNRSNIDCNWLFSSFNNSFFLNEYINKCVELKNSSLKELELKNLKDSIVNTTESLENLLFQVLEKEKLNKIIGSYKVTLKDKMIIEDLPITNNDRWVRIENLDLPDWNYNIDITEKSVIISY